MTLHDAIEELLNSERFKQAAKQDAKLRVYAGRLKKERIRNNIEIDLLLQFGYTIEVKKPKK